MIEPTPRPWTIEPLVANKGRAFLHGPEEETGDGGLIIGTTHNHADAVLIVRAVNAHDGLVAALKALYDNAHQPTALHYEQARLELIKAGAL